MLQKQAKAKQIKYLIFIGSTKSTKALSKNWNVVIKIKVIGLESYKWVEWWATKEKTKHLKESLNADTPAQPNDGIGSNKVTVTLHGGGRGCHQFPEKTEGAELIQLGFTVQEHLNCSASNWTTLKWKRKKGVCASSCKQIFRFAIWVFFLSASFSPS